MTDDLDRSSTEAQLRILASRDNASLQAEYDRLHEEGEKLLDQEHAEMHRQFPDMPQLVPQTCCQDILRMALDDEAVLGDIHTVIQLLYSFHKRLAHLEGTSVEVLQEIVEEIHKEENPATEVRRARVAIDQRMDLLRYVPSFREHMKHRESLSKTIDQLKKQMGGQDEPWRGGGD